MPEYLAPGVFVEETGRWPSRISGVPTSTAAVLGVTGQGPTAPTRVTSFAEYRRLYGNGGGEADPMLYAVAGFFDNGGSRAVIVRIAPRGADGPVVADFEGEAVGEAAPTGLAALDLSEHAEAALVYAPEAHAIPGVAASLIAHCERNRYRFAVLDAPAGATHPAPPADTRHGALYHPWIEVADLQTGTRRLVPPGGHVLGVYARVDSARGVWKAPANEVIRGATGLAADVTAQEQDALNVAGVNVIRRLPGRGIRVWGARTLSSEPEWKYVSVRRLFIYLERSIDAGTQWAVFEPNDERSWAQLRESVRMFLSAEWRAGALAGVTEKDAFFVKCDRTTMTQDDLDHGRLICLIGVAALRPAEFVIFRIGLWTADRKP